MHKLRKSKRLLICLQYCSKPIIPRPQRPGNDYFTNIISDSGLRVCRAFATLLHPCRSAAGYRSWSHNQINSINSRKWQKEKMKSFLIILTKNKNSLTKYSKQKAAWQAAFLHFLTKSLTKISDSLTKKSSLDQIPFCVSSPALNADNSFGFHFLKQVG